MVVLSKNKNRPSIIINFVLMFGGSHYVQTMCCNFKETHSSLVLTMDGTDCDGVVYLQVKSRAAVVLTGWHLVTGTGRKVRSHHHIVPLDTVLGLE